MFVALAACSSSSEASTPPITTTGSWIGTIGAQTMSATLTQTGDSVTGTAALTGTTSGVIQFTVAGSYTAPSVSFTMSSTGFNPVYFTGTVAAASITGVLDGSGFTNSAITLLKP